MSKITLPALFVGLVVGTGCTVASSSTSSGSDALTENPAFAGSAAPVSVKIDGHDATLKAPSSHVVALVKEMTHANPRQNNSFYAGVYTLAPAELSDFDSPINDFAARKYIAYDLMFRIDGSTPGSDKGFGWNSKWDSGDEKMGCNEVPDGKALSRFEHFSAYTSSHDDPQISQASRDLLTHDAPQVVSALFDSSPLSATLYECHWDNEDDTNADALVLTDEMSGEVRVLLAFDGA
jgi:hypothetical protein